MALWTRKYVAGFDAYALLDPAGNPQGFVVGDEFSRALVHLLNQTPTHALTMSHPEMDGLGVPIG